ncbi:MAG: hypothetical protein HQL02_10725 [Nitrospirae bacterium]|nr:hypothetical protein [Nitrospirota bacterium]
MRVALPCLVCLSLLLTVTPYKGIVADAVAGDEELRTLIDNAREEVMNSPTGPEDLPKRVFLLNRWARMLFEQGMDVNRIYPWQRAIHIDRLSNADPRQATAIVDAAYADLERFVATYRQDPVQDRLLLSEINKTRRELKTTPTSANNLKHRLYCLNQWARLLIAEGFDAGSIYTLETSMMLASDAEIQPDKVSPLVDNLLASLESIQAIPVITRTDPTPLPPKPPNKPTNNQPANRLVKVDLEIDASSAQLTEGVARYDSGRLIKNTGADFKQTRIKAQDGSISIALSTVPVFVQPEGGPLDGCDSTLSYSPFGMLAGDFDSLRKAAGNKYAGNLAADLAFRHIRFIGPNGLHFMLYRRDGDRYLDRLKTIYDDAISKGLGVMVTIDPSTASVAPGAFNRRGEFAREDVKSYTDFLDAAIRKFPKVKDYALDTEADASWQPEDYADTLAITYKTIKAQCQDCRLTTSGLFKNDLKFYEQVFEALRQKNAKRSFDYLGMWHPYGGMQDNGVNVNEYEPIRQHYRDTVALLERYGYVNMPIFIGETGYPSDSCDTALATPHSERRQAGELIKQFVTAIAIGVKRLYWATTVDYHRFGGVEGYFDYTGLIHNPDNKHLTHKKLSYYSYSLLIKKLSCFENAKVTQIPNLQGASGYKFEKGGNSLYILWADEPGEGISSD